MNNISDRTIRDITIKDTQQDTSSEKNNSDQAKNTQSETTSAENTIQNDQSQDQGQSISNIKNDMKQSINDTQSSEVLPQTGIKDNQNISTGYMILSSSLLLLTISLKIMGTFLKKIV